MSSNGKPCPQSCSPSLLQALPPELLHQIFDQLSLQDVLTARRTCSMLASVGISHSGDEIPLVDHRDKFRSLCEIAEHPRLAEQMRSLFYRFDRCRWVPYEEWDGARPDPGPRTELTDLAVDKHSDQANQELRFSHYLEDYYGYEAIKARKNSVRVSDRREGYKAFEALCRDTADIHKSGYDLKCLRSLFRGCRKLREVTVATTHSYRDSLEDFVLNGGEWPREFSPVTRPDGSEMLLEIPDDYMELDDPARDYDSDEFDF